ncbi:hypothetical protein CONLIGDRAFT_673900 [Coniochaeta ligniaria NRRL 30616]|uniref:Chromo domain-containing protein n=1 Tax=Coniochaeta ligniaria NRRL 30616 TaxID=1408157 RepID=A0A1J7I9J9_9PEZI|nr:hypothetical protein CONLIGDRAFT_673900 [Coniochaeta ligniaria NRRL 30616]
MSTVDPHSPAKGTRSGNAIVVASSSSIGAAAARPSTSVAATTGNLRVAPTGPPAPEKDYIPDFHAIRMWKDYKSADGVVCVDFELEEVDGTVLGWFREIDVWKEHKDTVLEYWDECDGRSAALGLNEATALFRPWEIIDKITPVAAKAKARSYPPPRENKRGKGKKKNDAEPLYVVSWVGYRETSQEKESRVKRYWPELLRRFDGVDVEDTEYEE